jgi:[protein-PII] uridylyltransferase
MSVVAQREDVYNEKTILAFASHFKTKKLIDMIYILTYADMNGVGNGIYNSFNSRLINTLYRQSLMVLDSKIMLDNATKRVKKEEKIKKSSIFQNLTKIEQKKILKIPSDLIFIRYSDKEIIDISTKAFKIKNYNIELKSSNYLTIEIIRKENFNLSYLLAKLNSLEVANMDIFKLFDGFKYFKIDFSKMVDNLELELIKEILDKSFNTDKEKNIKKPIIKIDELKIDCEHSKDYATMNLNTKDQKGLIAFIIQVFDQEGVDITSA